MALFQAQLATRSASSAAPFNPSSISGLVSWIRADTGVLNGGNPATNGQVVDTWTDQSTAAKNYTSSGSSRPTLVTGVVNGQPIVRFDGTNDYVATATYNLTQPLTYFLVAKIRTAANSKYIYNGTTTGGACACAEHSTDASAVGLESATPACDAAWGATNFVISRAIFNGASSSQRVNNGTASSGNPGTNAPSILIVGASDNTGFIAAAIDVAEYLIYSKVVSAGEETNVVNYLSARYGITIS